VAPETNRLAELRRRVQSDPASIAFAQLAEEYRRAGEHQEAVMCARAGLARHPGYLSARVTLGRALLELGALDEAAHELGIVLLSAPDNLAAIRAMAEIHHRRGAMDHALEYYKRALALARFDPHLEETVRRIDREIEAVSGVASFAPEEPLAPPVDFDALLAALGAPDAAPPFLTERLLSQPGASGASSTASMPEPSEVANTQDDFAKLERDLRRFSQRADVQVEHRIISELEAWLRALEAARSSAHGRLDGPESS
jgi:tetratricopeptide (TPR) repeat protein